MSRQYKGRDNALTTWEKIVHMAKLNDDDVVEKKVETQEAMKETVHS